jgi:hypothetical protein
VVARIRKFVHLTAGLPAMVPNLIPIKFCGALSQMAAIEGPAPYYFRPTLRHGNERADFSLNRGAYRDATILPAGRNSAAVHRAGGMYAFMTMVSGAITIVGDIFAQIIRTGY